MSSAKIPATVAVMLALVLAGCIDSAPQALSDDGSAAIVGSTPPDARVPANASAPRVVVAVIDTGINPYHTAFQRAGGLPDDVLAELTDGDEPAQRIALSKQATYEERVAADSDVLEALTPGTLYYFEGTNVLGISFSNNEVYHVVDDPNDGHGTGTSGAVLQAHPGAIIVLVEGLTADSEAWAARTPWVDIVSMSYGPIGSIPGSGSVFGLSTHEATRIMWGQGKVPVGAADNTPALAPNDETAGPPWVIGVGGDHEATRCRDHVSGTFPDFTSNFTQELPRHDSIDEKRSMSGTSFATPKTAGTIAAVLHQVRAAWGHQGGIIDGALAVDPDGQRVTNADIRDALNQTAYYFDFFECQPGGTTQGPVNPAAPWLQMGWGHVGDDSIAPAVAHLLGQPAPSKDAGATAFQQALYEYRRASWALTG